MHKTLIAAVLAAGALTPLSAQAQTAPAGAPAAAAPAATAPTVGATIYGKEGAEIGRVEKVDGANFVLAIGETRATLPANALFKGDKGLTLSMTKAEVETAIGAATQQADTKLAASLVAGAPVVSKDAAPVATVQKVEGDNVTLDLAAGGSVALGKSFFAIGADGKLALTLTAAEFQSAVNAAKQAQATPAAGTPAPGAG